MHAVSSRCLFRELVAVGMAVHNLPAVAPYPVTVPLEVRGLMISVLLYALRITWLVSGLQQTSKPPVTRLLTLVFSNYGYKPWCREGQILGDSGDKVNVWYL
jgi:hypothetical protein